MHTYTAEREGEREREKERERERQRIVVATQPISLVVGFTYGLAPLIAYWRERGGERERERERRAYAVAKKQGAFNSRQKAEIVILYTWWVLNPRQKAAPPTEQRLVGSRKKEIERRNQYSSVWTGIALADRQTEDSPAPKEQRNKKVEPYPIYQRLPVLTFRMFLVVLYEGCFTKHRNVLIFFLYQVGQQTFLYSFFHIASLQSNALVTSKWILDRTTIFTTELLSEKVS